MSQEDQNYIPKHLDNLPRFAIWDIYQALIFFMIFGFSVILHMIFYGLVFGVVFAWFYGKLSSGQSRGFLIHLLYWFTPMGKGYKVIPESHKRHFQG